MNKGGAMNYFKNSLMSIIYIQELIIRKKLEQKQTEILEMYKSLRDLDEVQFELFGLKENLDE